MPILNSDYMYLGISPKVCVLHEQYSNILISNLYLNETVSFHWTNRSSSDHFVVFLSFSKLAIIVSPSCFARSTVPKDCEWRGFHAQIDTRATSFERLLISNSNCLLQIYHLQEITIIVHSLDNLTPVHYLTERCEVRPYHKRYLKAHGQLPQPFES